MKRIKSYLDYTTRAGDTFDALALAAYNDEKQASEIIKFNPDYSDVLIFGEGIKLRIPVFDGADIPEAMPPWRS